MTYVNRHKRALSLASALGVLGALSLSVPAVAATDAATAMTATGVTLFKDLTGAPTSMGAFEPTLSDDGKVAVFNVYAGSASSAYTVDATNGVKVLAKPGTATDYFVRGISADGSVISGSGLFGSNYGAVQWKAGVATVLPGLVSNSIYSSAEGVSGNGQVIVGSAHDGSNYLPVMWVNGATPTKLGGSTIIGGSANAASSDGAVIVGMSRTSAQMRGEAFRWTQAGGMVQLGLLGTGGALAFSDARAVSADGSVVAGNVFDSTEHSQMFRWTQSGGMVGLGFLSGGTTSYVSSMTGDGNTIVGSAIQPITPAVTNGPSMESTAVLWTQAGGLQTLAAYLGGKGLTLPAGTKLVQATAVSDDGSLFVGDAVVGNQGEAFIARTSAGGGGGAGVVTVTPFLGTVAGAAGIQSGLGAVTSMSLNGAHHRSLSDYTLEGGTCAWATGDFGASGGPGRQQYFGEVGMCRGFGEGVKAGLGIGYGALRSDLALGGKARAHGYHLVAEVDVQPQGSPLAFSFLGYFADWSINTDRNYANGALTDTSFGHTGARAWALRARADARNLAKIGGASVSPYLAYTHSNTVVDGYTETGGGFPVTVARSSQHANETRLGTTLGLPLAEKVKLGVSGEWVHRFDKGITAVAGTIVGGPAFAFAGGALPQDWGRGGLDLDVQTSASSVLSFSAHATVGQARDADFSGSISYRIGF